jgi:hypothetical protein
MFASRVAFGVSRKSPAAGSNWATARRKRTVLLFNDPFGLPGGLRRFSDVSILPPERKPRTEQSFSGMVRLPAPDPAGIYEVTFSHDAWIDMVQDGRYARSVGATGRNDCPGLRKSVRFELGPTPLVLQLSGVPADAIVVAITRAE